VGESAVFLDRLEPLGHGAAAGTRARLVGSGQPAREIALPCRLCLLAARRERRGEDEMRIAVGWIAAHRLAQPVDRRLWIAKLPGRIAKVEDVVGIVGIGLRGLLEVVRRLAAVLSGAAAPQLYDAEIVRHGGRRPR